MHHSPLTTHHSPLTTHHSPLTTHHSPLTTHHSPLTTHHSPLTKLLAQRMALVDLAVAVGDEAVEVAAGVLAGHVRQALLRDPPQEQVLVLQVAHDVPNRRPVDLVTRQPPHLFHHLVHL